MATQKTEAQKRAQKAYMSNFCEVKVRMTPDRRELIKAHAAKMEESTTEFINRAIDEAMKRDEEKQPQSDPLEE